MAKEDDEFITDDFRLILSVEESRNLYAYLRTQFVMYDNEVLWKLMDRLRKHNERYDLDKDFKSS